MLLELVDQSDLDRRIYQCVNCSAQGQSAPAFAADGYFFDGSEKPGKWVRHVCDPAALAPPKAPKAKRAAPVAPVVEPAPKRKPGRPKLPKPVA